MWYNLPGTKNATGFDILYKETNTYGGEEGKREWIPSVRVKSKMMVLVVRKYSWEQMTLKNIYWKVIITVNRLGLESSENILWYYFFNITTCRKHVTRRKTSHTFTLFITFEFDKPSVSYTTHTTYTPPCNLFYFSLSL